MAEKQIPDFVRVLHSAKSADYAYFNYNSCDAKEHTPTVSETVSHLKLLRAFARLKQIVVTPNTQHPEAEIKQWQVYVTNAARRFVCYLTALRNYAALSPNDGLSETETFNKCRQRDKRFIEIMESHLPPIDVVMVWHAFLLNPKSFYDHMIRNNFLPFLIVPFPLKPLSDSIDDTTFDYIPQKHLEEGFQKIMMTYDMEVQYTFTEKFDPTRIVVPLICPICKEFIGTDVPLTTPDMRGFADSGFLYKDYNNRCLCSMPKAITHDELRKRQLCKDSTSPLPLPYMFKFYSNVMGGKFMKKNAPWEIDPIVKSDITRTIIPKISNSFLSLERMILDARGTYFRRFTNIVRQYLVSNLLYLTIPNQDSFVILEDLVAAVLRQERFVKAVNEMDWLHSPVLKESMGESVIRYTRFLNLLLRQGTTKTLVPTVDIDLVWHTHQLSPVFYFGHCMGKVVNIVIDHDDKVEQARLDDCFERTAKYYRSQFNEEYSICYCWYCICIRNKSASKLKSLFKKKKSESELMKEYEKSKLFSSTLGLTHISSHNSIILPNRYSTKKNSAVQEEYGKNLPWTDDKIYFYNYYPSMYVTPIDQPMSDESCRLIGGGQCMTSSGVNSTCSGVKGCVGAFCAPDSTMTNGDGGATHDMNNHVHPN